MSDYLTDEEQLDKLKKWWEENGLMLAGAVVVAVAGLVGWNWYGEQKAATIAGSSDLYGFSGRRPHASINFLTAHDGFTLADLVSYNDKHNLPNGEEESRKHDQPRRRMHDAKTGPDHDQGPHQRRRDPEAAGRALARVRAELGDQAVVRAEPAAAHLDRVAGKAHDPLDQPPALVPGEAEHRDVPPLGASRIHLRGHLLNRHSCLGFPTQDHR